MVKLERPESKEKYYLYKPDKELLRNAKQATINANIKDHTAQDCSFNIILYSFQFVSYFEPSFFSPLPENLRKVCCFQKFLGAMEREYRFNITS